MDFNFDLAEPLETRTTSHQRNFSRSLLSNIKFEPRTAEQREADAKRNAPKYAREKAVNSMLTARFLKAKKTFDAFYGYNIDEAWDGDAGAWREEADPWLRIPAGATDNNNNGDDDDTVTEFLRGYTRQRVEAHKEEVEKELVSADELEALAGAVLRVARVDLEAAGRDNKSLDADFKKRVLGVVAELKTEYNLPQSAPEDQDEEEVEEETNGVGGA
ncbi:hypothetical protein M406DRAFT_105227 [Cryphonectria parasitica EP155]|uniref:Uncharacterized protein n=1 Tax=Cryphonectria parasitica (strain ATCC 38755 / EP155) TaxID=660469 RepID=A0A9P4YBU6_CRYP1|nr:uncharacterized protein M406DRAFT_105227 [Cryphonectria parasitica EP155]KAF3770144.1 hypothetical protein M406DRAFT_105227 [Cryphonectria parasitica EP155]